MPSRNVPSVRLRRIGSALRKAREDSGLTIDTACRRYGRSKSWLSTLENGLHSIDPQELADLLDFYEVPDGPLRESLLHLAARDPSKNWERVREGRISAAALDLASLEEDSELIRTFQPCVIPGLLQIPGYTRALIAAGPPVSARMTRTLIEFRMTRQRVLEQPNSPRFIAVISESVLRHQVGDHSVMHAQLRRLVEAAQQKHVKIRVLPDTEGAYLWLAGAFGLFTLRPPGRLTVAMVEQFTKSLFLEKEDDIALTESTFARLIDASLSEDASLWLIEELTSKYDSSRDGRRLLAQEQHEWRGRGRLRGGDHHLGADGD